jgi:hypothetical protein
VLLLKITNSPECVILKILSTPTRLHSLCNKQMKRWWNDSERNKTDVFGEVCPSATFSTEVPTRVGSVPNPVLCGERSATKQLEP